MPIAVQFYFDDAFRERICDIWKQMSAAQMGEWVRQIGTEPHLSLAVFDDDVERDLLLATTRDFAARFGQLEMSFATLGVFPMPKGIVFLSPIPSRQMLDAHRTYHTMLENAGLASRPYYTPGAWVPHCTIGAKLEPTQVGPIIEMCLREFDFPQAICASIGIMEVPPIAELARWAVL